MEKYVISHLMVKCNGDTPKKAIACYNFAITLFKLPKPF